MADDIKQPPPALSSPSELANAGNVTVSDVGADGHPTHTPRVSAQTCLDVLTGQKHEYWANSWH